MLVYQRVPLNMFGDSVDAAILKVSGLSSLGRRETAQLRAIYFPTWNQHILPNHYSSVELLVPRHCRNGYPTLHSSYQLGKFYKNPSQHQYFYGAVRAKTATPKTLSSHSWSIFVAACCSIIFPSISAKKAIPRNAQRVPHLLQEDVHHAVEIKNGLAPPAAGQGGHEGVVGDHICLEAHHLQNTSTRNPAHPGTPSAQSWSCFVARWWFWIIKWILFPKWFVERGCYHLVGVTFIILSEGVCHNLTELAKSTSWSWSSWGFPLGQSVRWRNV